MEISNHVELGYLHDIGIILLCHIYKKGIGGTGISLHVGSVGFAKSKSLVTPKSFRSFLRAIHTTLSQIPNQL